MVWGGLPIKEKAVAALDEDTLTMSIEAARNALMRARIDVTELRGLGRKRVAPVRREAPPRRSWPRQSGPRRMCRQPTSSLRKAGARLPSWALASWARGWTLRAGHRHGHCTGDGPAKARIHRGIRRRGAFIVGPAEESAAVIEATSPTSRIRPISGARAYAHYPSHGHRFTGEPAYFEHVVSVQARS